MEETRYYLILANYLGYADTTDLRKNLDEIARMLDGYMKSIKNKQR